MGQMQTYEVVYVEGLEAEVKRLRKLFREVRQDFFEQAEEEIREYADKGKSWVEIEDMPKRKKYFDAETEKLCKGEDDEPSNE
ncbi:hypothetical protein LCGC14_0249490 [marine sediment metagenome]|uniref:Uncharacterized protein n=1 Tax=marine sediment metagenome TaxID=412755 RepID=A0A0F9WQB4_9ZZZZ